MDNPQRTTFVPVADLYPTPTDFNQTDTPVPDLPTDAETNPPLNFLGFHVFPQFYQALAPLQPKESTYLDTRQLEASK